MKRLIVAFLAVACIAVAQQQVQLGNPGVQLPPIPNPEAGAGTVTSVGVTTPTGLLVNTGQSASVTTSGTFAFTFGGAANQIPTSNGSGGLNWTAATMATNGNTLTFAGASTIVDGGTGAQSFTAAGSNHGFTFNVTGTGNLSLPVSGSAPANGWINVQNSGTNQTFITVSNSASGLDAGALSGGNAFVQAHTANNYLSLNPQTFSSSSASQVGVLINPTINQTSTAGMTALKVSETVTAAGSGNQYLIDLLAGASGTTDVFHVTSGGVVFGTGGSFQTFGSTSQWQAFGTASNGLILSGNGSSNDIQIQNASQGAAITVAHNSTNVTIGGTLATTGAVLASTAPTNGAGTWGLGTLRTGTGFVFDTTRSVEITIGGTRYDLAVITTTP